MMSDVMVYAQDLLEYLDGKDYDEELVKVDVPLLKYILADWLERTKENVSDEGNKER